MFGTNFEAFSAKRKVLTFATHPMITTRWRRQGDGPSVAKALQTVKIHAFNIYSLLVTLGYPTTNLHT
jgi:hypothetical protein